MPSIDENIQLATEMAAISAVKSEEIVNLVGTTSELDKFQDKLSESQDRVRLVKAVLGGVQPHEVTPELAAAMDNQLARAVELEIPPAEGMSSVEGSEALGYTLMPQDYIMTRLQGCENFMGDFYKKSREVATRIGAAVKETYILVMSSHDSLESAIEALESSINATPNFNGDAKLVLGSREFNLFKVAGKISEDWGGELSKLSKSITGISNNYYLNSRNRLNTAMSYFGGFADADAESGEERFLMLPTALYNERFKDCSIPNREYTTSLVTAKQSVELMGGAYFLDIRLTNPQRGKLSSLDAAQDYLNLVLTQEKTGFENSAPMVFPKLGNEISTLGSGQIKMVVKHLREMIKEWRKVFDAAEKFKLVDNDYKDITTGIYESAMTEDLKDRALTAFGSVIRENQMEILNVRVAVNSYLVLLINALIDFCHNSIKANTN